MRIGKEIRWENTRGIAMRILDYTFFKIFQFLEEFADSPNFATIIVLFWLFQFNVFSGLGFILNSSAPSTVVGISSFLSTANVIILAVLILALHFLYYYRKKRYQLIIDRYKDENKKSSIFGALLVVLYVAFTIGVFFLYTVPNIGGILSNA